MAQAFDRFVTDRAGNGGNGLDSPSSIAWSLRTGAASSCVGLRGGGLTVEVHH
jgi:hypothetical protein